jgi:hypothetical protein
MPVVIRAGGPVRGIRGFRNLVVGDDLGGLGRWRGFALSIFVLLLLACLAGHIAHGLRILPISEKHRESSGG